MNIYQKLSQNSTKFLTDKTKDKFCRIRPRISDDELKAPHMLISASVTAGKNGVNKVLFLVFRKCPPKPQIARTALIRTMAGLSAPSAPTVASMKLVIAGREMRLGNLEPIQRHRPSKKGDTKIIIN